MRDGYRSPRRAASAALLTLVPSVWASAQVTVGVNMAPVEYFSREIVFTDIAKQFQPFQLKQSGVDDDLVDPSLTTFDANGYAISLGSDQYLETTWDKPKGYSEGRHVLLYDGVGDIEFALNATDINQTAPGRIEFDFTRDFDRARMQIRIRQTDPTNHIRNIRVVPLYAESDYATGQPLSPFRQSALDNWSHMTTLRFMDWPRTNGSNITQWSERNSPTYHTQAENGVALEYQIQLANQMQVNPWFTIPHMADDSYIRQAANLIRDNLDPTLQARIEFSNEVWNDVFSQARYAIEQGLLEGFDTDPNQARLAWYSKRSVETFRIFEDVFTQGGIDPTGMDRVLRVMGAQAVNTFSSERVLGFEYDWDGNGTAEEASEYTDVLAIAPYFGEVIRTPEKAAEYLAMTPAQMIEATRADLQEVAEEMVDQKAVADRFGVRLFAYEGGVHLRGALGQENNQALTDALTELNSHPGMRDLYIEFLTAWEAAGGEEILLYNSMSDHNKWGSWGLLEYETQPLGDAPKYLAVLEFLSGQTPWLVGDYDDDGVVGQDDLDLVLQLWGLAFEEVNELPAAWVNTLGVTTPLIGQDELANVINNWGNTAPTVAQLRALAEAAGLSDEQIEGLIPEPSALGMLVVPLLVLARRRRAVA